MNNITSIIRPLRLLVLTGLVTGSRAQEVSVPAPGLNAAIRETLQKMAAR